MSYRFSRAGCGAGLAVTALFCGVSWAGDGVVATFRGLGPVKLGDTVGHISRSLARSIRVPKDPDEAACFHAPGPGGSSLLIEDGVVVRIDVRVPGIRTARGAQVGDSIERIHKLYGSRLREEPHFYAGLPELYMTVLSSSGKASLRFETSAGKIDAWFIGQSAAVKYVEGCQ